MICMTSTNLTFQVQRAARQHNCCYCQNVSLSFIGHEIVSVIRFVAAASGHPIGGARGVVVFGLSV